MVNITEFRVACLRAKRTQEDIAKDYGVERTYVCQAIRGKIKSEKAKMIVAYANDLIRQYAS